MRLSVITINLNNAPGLIRTIESVIAQDYGELEYIVIDGGSSDDSMDVINRYSSRISSWISEKDDGIYQAMNKGIRLAKGEYCLFLNSGDWLLSPDSLQRFMASVEDEDIVTSHWGDYIYDGIIPTRGFTFYLFYKVSFMHFNTVIRRELFEKIGCYDESFKIVSDWLFFLLAIFRYNCRVKVVDFVMAQNEVPGVSLSQMELQKSERMRVLEQYFPYFMDDYKELLRMKQSRIIRMYDRIYASPLAMGLYKKIQRLFTR